ncbi:MAG: PBS lyase HEAT-like repeat protein [Promethearchaeota archaeon]|nr:MAG: PBS lyase HEAT-like repeat protein [Candidatus Lokiarchaeota archaeon]
MISILDSNLLPREVYQKKDEFGIENTIFLLKEIINKGEKEKEKDAIKYLGLIDSKETRIKEDCFKTLENILITDDDISIKCEAARALGNLCIENSLNALKWVLDQPFVTDDLKKVALKAIANIRFEDPEINLFIKELGNYNPSIREVIKTRLIYLDPTKLIKSLLSALHTEDLSRDHQLKIIELIGYEIASLNVSFESYSYIRANFPEILNELNTSKELLLKVIISNQREKDQEFMEEILSIMRLFKEDINDFLIEQLKTDDYIVKSNVARLIGKLHINNAQEALIESIDDIYSNVSIACLESLGLIANPSVVPTLCKILNVEDYEFEYVDLDLKWYILETIINIYERSPTVSYEYLYSTLENGNDLLRESIAYIMGELQRKEFVEPLINSLEEKHFEVKKNVIIALGKIGHISALKPLLSLLEEENVYWLIKKVTIDAISNFFDNYWFQQDKIDEELKRSLIKARTILADYLKRNKDECFKIKIGLIKFLEKFGDKDSIPALNTCVADFHKLVKISSSKAIKAIQKKYEDE